MTNQDNSDKADKVPTTWFIHANGIVSAFSVFSDACDFYHDLLIAGASPETTLFYPERDDCDDGGILPSCYDSDILTNVPEPTLCHLRDAGYEVPDCDGCVECLETIKCDTCGVYCVTDNDGDNACVVCYWRNRDNSDK